MNHNMKSILLFVFALSLLVVPTTHTLAKEAVLRLAVQHDFAANLDPVRIPTPNDPQMQVAVLEGLVRYKLGTYEIEPCLATRWEQSKDGLTWTFFLRKGVKFHYGYGELKASDVVYTFNRSRDKSIKGNFIARHLVAIKNIIAENDYTVRFELSKSDAAFLFRLAGFTGYVVSEKALKERGDEFGQKPVATGPYMFDHWIPGQEAVVVKNVDYWGGKPKLDRVFYLPIPDVVTTNNAFQAGDLDLISVTQPQKLLRFRKDPKIEVQSVPGLNVRHIGMNAHFKPFDNLKVRQAVAYAINRDEIVKGLWKGSSTPASNFFPPMVNHSASGLWNPVYDPAKAKKLLAEAGYPNGFKTVMHSTPIDRFMKPALIVKEQLKAIGIELKIESQEIAAFLGPLRKGQMPLFSMIKGLDPYPDRVINGQFHSKNFPGDNWTSFQYPEVDKWLDQANNSRDKSLRDELFKKVQQTVINKLHFYPIDHESYHMAYHKKVKGFVADSKRTIRLDNVYIAE